MATKTSSHFKASLDGAELHNERLKELDYVRKDLSHLNEYWKAPGFISVKQAKKDVANRYMAAHGRKLPKNATPIQETVVVIKEDTTMAQLQDLAKEIEKKWGYKPLAIYIHKDEGHENAFRAGKWVPNLHAHMVFDTADSKGETLKTVGDKIRRYQRAKWEKKEAEAATREGRQPRSFSEPAFWKKPTYDELQTITAQILDMERGVSSNQRHLDAITYKVKARQKTLENLHQAIVKGERKFKGLNTMIRNLENDIINNEAEIVEMKAELEKFNENAKEREELVKELEKLRSEHSRLEQKIEGRKQQLKDAEISLEILAKKYKYYTDENQNLREKIKLEREATTLGCFIKQPNIKEAYENFLKWKSDVEKFFGKVVDSIWEFAANKGSVFNEEQTLNIMQGIIYKCRLEGWSMSRENFEKAADYFFCEYEAKSIHSDFTEHIVSVRLGQLAADLFQSVDRSSGISSGGGTSNITDLTGWDGRRKR